MSRVAGSQKVVGERERIHGGLLRKLSSHFSPQRANFDMLKHKLPSVPQGQNPGIPGPTGRYGKNPVCFGNAHSPGNAKKLDDNFGAKTCKNPWKIEVQPGLLKTSNPLSVVLLRGFDGIGF
jgi:hypothetical protein